MTGFEPRAIRCHLGFDHSHLSASQERLESSAEFKRAAEAAVDRLFDQFLQGRSFERPYSGAQRPAVTLSPDAFGDRDPAQLLAFVKGQVENHWRGNAGISVSSASATICLKTPTGWIEIGGFFIDVDGQRLVADTIVDDFEATYRANRPSLSKDFDADCQSLRSLPLVFFVESAI